MAVGQERVVAAIGRVIAHQTPANVARGAVDVIAEEISDVGKVDSSGRHIRHADLGLVCRARSRRRERDVLIRRGESGGEGPIRNHRELRVRRNAGEIILPEVHRDRVRGVGGNGIGVAFLGIGDGGGTNQRIIMIRLRARRVDKLARHPRAAAHRDRGPSRRRDSTDKSRRPDKRKGDEGIRIPEEGIGREPDRIGDDGLRAGNIRKQKAAGDSDREEEAMCIHGRASED